MAIQLPIVRPKRERVWGGLLAGLIALLGLGLAACGSTAPAGGAGAGAAVAQPAAAPQTSEGGQVTMKVTWAGPSAGPAFSVVMDTHAVDLDGYDLRQLAVLRTGDGREVRPTGWDAAKGGHHRQGTLVFPATAPDGSAVIGPTTRTIELAVRDVAGVPERTFRWTL